MVILAPIISGFLLFWVRKGDKPDTSRIGFQENLNSKDTTSVISVPNFIRDLS